MKKSLFLKSGLFVSTMTVSLSSLAADEATNYAQQAFAQLNTEANNYLGYAWPVVVAITVGLIGIKLFKKFANRAA